MTALLIAGLLAGCADKPETTPVVSGTEAPDEPAVSDADQAEATPAGLEYPMLCEEPVELSWFYPLGSTPLTWIEDYSASPTIQELERRTNVRISWYNCYVDFCEEKYNLMLVSDEMTDIITHRFVDMTAYVTGDRAITDGYYLRLNELIDDYMPNYKALLESDYDAYVETLTDTGNIWAFYKYADPAGYYTPDCSGVAYRRDIAASCGLTETPETIEEWEEFFDVLIENGYETPYLITHNGLNPSEIFNSAFDVDHSFYQVDGVVKYGPAEDGYYEFVKLMNKWINKGYAYRDFYSTDAWTAVSVGDVVVSWMTSYFIGDTAAAWMGPDFFIEPAPDPRLTKDQTIHLHTALTRMSDPTSITTACENVEIACRLIDYLYSDEGITLCNYGVEGVTYNVVNGEPDYTDYMFHYTETSMLEETMEAFLFIVTTRDLSLKNKYSDKNRWASSIMFRNTDNAYELPATLNMTDEENSEFSAIMTDVETFVAESIVSFILGDKPLEKWDDYIQTLTNIKLDRAIEIKQASYDRYLAGKAGR
mgnify:CR=1 FL=1